MPYDRLPPDDAGPLRHDDGAPYPAVEPQPSFPEVERSMLEHWAADRTFEASVEARPTGRDGENEYVFYDGPPFANGLPHYGHLLTGFVKDAVPRYQTMRGRRVERRFGWDCHGLPAEMEAERELGISGRALITEYGIERFNDHCRTSVLRYTSEWERYVTRQARWVDFRNDYKTMDLPYMESVMWALKQLWERGLLYEGHRVLPYCWECETPLSNFETRQDDAYRERQDPAVTVAFTLSDGRRILVWTTTPWTLPSNLALAVGADIDYAVFRHEDGMTTLLGEAAVPRYERELDGADRVGTVAGRDLLGLGYEPLFGWLQGTPNAFRVVAGDFVATDEGTGVVHMAPGFGEDDQRVCEDNGIPVVCPVDDRGRFTAEIADYEGLQVFAANARIVKDLRAAGALVRHDTIVHSYPHCWRTDTPLIYKAVSSWFVDVRAVKDRMLELNQEITWVPERVRDGAFGKWLENARDWSISRNRFWGSPIPVWKSDDPAHPRVDVYGSLDELERDFGVRPDDLHRPAIDRLTRPNPDDPTGRSTMRRVEDVLDCWFESGSMPFAQVHYPFEQRDWFESHFPADFIVEYIGQTRGWFYTLHVLATALFDRPPFTTCVAHGVVLGHDGQKMSKRLRNYPDPDEVFDTLGADAMRWFLLSSPVLRGADLVVDGKGITGALRRSISPLWNAWSFFTLYANAEGYRARWRTDSADVLDRYVLAKAHELVAGVTARMDEYDLFGACALVESFLDALTNWYIRRSRDRFWATSPADPEETAHAFDTLFTVLHVVCRVAAPLLPLVTEAVFRGLTGERSVHLTDWPGADEVPADVDLVDAMDLARDVCSAAHSVRKAAELRSRLPLASLTVAAPGADRLAPFAPLIAAELNVKDVRLSDDVGSAGDLVLQVVPAVLGPRIGPEVQAVIRAAKSGDWSRDDGAVVVAGRRLAEDEYTLRLVPRDGSTTRPLPGDRGLVVLDLAVTPDLEAEGLARDVVRLVNDARKEAGLQVTDRIRLVLQGPDDLRTAVEAHRAYVADQTLAVEVLFVEHLAGGYRGELPDGRAVHIGVSPLAH